MPNIFIVNNKDNRTTPGVCIVNFKHICTLNPVWTWETWTFGPFILMHPTEGRERINFHDSALKDNSNPGDNLVNLIRNWKFEFLSALVLLYLRIINTYMAMHRKGCYKMMDTKTYEWLKNIDEFSGVTYLLTCALFLT